MKYFLIPILLFSTHAYSMNAAGFVASLWGAALISTNNTHLHEDSIFQPQLDKGNYLSLSYSGAASEEGQGGNSSHPGYGITLGHNLKGGSSTKLMFELDYRKFRYKSTSLDEISSDYNGVSLRVAANLLSLKLGYGFFYNGKGSENNHKSDHGLSLAFGFHYLHKKFGVFLDAPVYRRFKDKKWLTGFEAGLVFKPF